MVEVPGMMLGTAAALQGGATIAANLSPTASVLPLLAFSISLGLPPPLALRSLFVPSSGVASLSRR